MVPLFTRYCPYTINIHITIAIVITTIIAIIAIITIININNKDQDKTATIN